jgi:hypothetical protein
VALNIARATAYWPQIMSIYRDPGRASAVSIWTWIVFTAANVTTVVHAVAGLEDIIVATVFAVNAIGCATIVVLTMYKRRCHRPPVQKHNGEELIPEPGCHFDRRVFHANSLL